MNVKVTLDQPTAKFQPGKTVLICQARHLRRKLALVKLSPSDAERLAEGDTITLMIDPTDNETLATEMRDLTSCWRIVMIETRPEGPFAYCMPQGPSFGRPMLLI